jgi:hypothetical protein
MIIVATVVAFGSAAAIAIAQQQAQRVVIGELANNEGIFVDAETFKITRGRAQGDPSVQIGKFDAKEVRSGAILVRVNDKLYLLSEDQPDRSPQGMREFFRSNWSSCIDMGC